MVLVIIVVLTSIAAPSLGLFNKGQRVSDASDDLLSLARWARSEAINRGINFRLNIDTSGRTYWLSMQNGGSYENLLQASSSSSTIGPDGSAQSTKFDAVGEEFGRKFTFPVGVNVESTYTPQPDGLFIQFRPTGRCDPGSVRLSDPQGKTIEVGCVTGSESFHILSDEERVQLQNGSLTPPVAQVR